MKKRAQISVLLSVVLLVASLTACGNLNLSDLEKLAEDLYESQQSEQTVTAVPDESGVKGGESSEKADKTGGESAALGKQLKTPAIFIDEEGRVSWYDLDLYDYCSNYLLSVNGVEENTDQSYTKKGFVIGDVIKVKALASASGTRSDSEWSAEYIYGRGTDYDFAGIGLTSDMEKALVFYTDQCAAGAYLYGSYIKCANGDMIYRHDNDDPYTDFTVYTAQDGYYKYDVDCGPIRTDYDFTDYGDNKLAYYTELYVIAGSMKMVLNADNSIVYRNAQEYIDMRGVRLLPVNEVEAEDPASYEMSSYTEYSGKINTGCLNSIYMDPKTRTFTYLSEFSDKIEYWRVQKINDPACYLDREVQIQFTKEFTHEDYQKLLDILKGYGLTPDYGDSFLAAVEGAYNSASGRLAVYTMPFEHEGDIWYDEYDIGGVCSAEYSLPYSMKVEYLYKYWYDGGSFATYVIRMDGLWRFVDKTGQKMIEQDGTRNTY